MVREAHTRLVIEHGSSSRLFKITRDGAAVGLITDDESLYVVSDGGGGAVEGCSFRNNLWFELNGSSDEKTATSGEK